jgi:receptor expression-enhancing protein 1/2/3/4
MEDSAKLTTFRVPFYAYFRLLVLSYLVLPQTQGAKLLYQTHIHPFLAHHEHDIDRFITSAHDRARSAGLVYLKRAIEFIKENVLGMQPKARPTHVQQPGANYAQSLLSRFNLPSARQGLAAPAGDFYGLLSAAVATVSTTSGTSREAQVENLSKSGTLIPQGMTSATEKMTFLSTQRERLRMLLTALDKEANDLGPEAAIEKDVDKRMAGAQLGEGLRKSKSEADFEEIDKDALEKERQGKTAAAGGWMPWNWSPKPDGGSKGAATGIDTGS